MRQWGQVSGRNIPEEEFVESSRHRRKRLAEAEKLDNSMVLSGREEFHPMGIKNLAKAMKR